MRPNILWICTDQQRYDTIGALGYDHVSTPHIDSLVDAGTAFTHAYCQSPICTPSRASFLTGMYASAVHVNGNGLEYFPDRPPLVTRLFADAGYEAKSMEGQAILWAAVNQTEGDVPKAVELFRAQQQAAVDKYVADKAAGKRNLVVSLGNDELGYIVPEYDFVLGFPEYLSEAEGDHYEETNSIGPQIAGVVAEEAQKLVDFLIWL